MNSRLTSLAALAALAWLDLTACRSDKSGAASSTGGRPGSGGDAASGGIGGNSGASGGSVGSIDASGAVGADLGGSSSLGGIGLGGASPSGGAGASGGTVPAGGRIGSGGIGSGGGATGQGATGGGSSDSLDAAAGGQNGPDGGGSTGGSAGSGGSASSDASIGGVRPCDIYQAANTPCVAAHSTVRALYAGYAGPLYQVRKGSSTVDILVGADGYADTSTQESLCAAGGCTIRILYDQSPKHNDLVKSPATLWLPNGGSEASATTGKITVSGRTVYGIYVDNPTGNVGYRNNNTEGVATGDEPEAMYMVIDGKRYSTTCCFDYGNSPTSGLDDKAATAEALNWNAPSAASKGGDGRGPWVGADLGDGRFYCDNPAVICSTNKSITWAFVTGMLKGHSGNRFVLKAGDAQSSPLQTMWDGARPPGYSPMKKQGGIILGTGVDGYNYGKGTFFEGCMTSGVPSDEIDDAIQANIVAAGYGR